MKCLFVLGVFVFALEAFAVWTVPSTTPTGGNTNSPFNKGVAPQQKTGALIVEGGFRSMGPVIFDTTLQIPISGYGANKVLTSDAGGNATWQTSSGGGGDTWTRDVSNTTTKLTNINDKVGIGIALPNNKLQVAGLINFNDTLFLTAVGKDALLPNTGANNSAFGHSALTVNSTGVSNTAIGKDALKANTIGSYNTALGDSALLNNISGSRNTALGYQALSNNVSGNDNTAIGYDSLKGGTSASGSFNTAIGVDSLSKITTGSNNTAVGNNSLNKLTTGSNNTSFGNYSFGGLTIGSNNTAIGVGAGSISNSSGPTAITNVTAITFGSSDITAANLQSNTMVFYSQTDAQVWIPTFGFGVNPQTTDLIFKDAIRVGTNTTNGNGARLTTTGTWTSASDRTKKHHIQNISTGLKEVLQLRPVDFKWNGTNKEDFGFIAQEVKPILPKLVHGEEGDMAISYSQMTAVLTRAIQEQQETIEDYKEKIKIYRDRVEELEKQKLNKTKNE